jgi:hypothetical protein
MTGARRHGEPRTTILLKDLDPGRDVRGGAGKRLFGEQAQAFEAPTAADVDCAARPVVEEPSPAKTSR